MTNPNPALIIRVTPALRARLDAHCKQSDAPVPMTAFVRQAIVEKLEREASRTLSNNKLENKK